MSIKHCREKAGKSVQDVAQHMGVTEAAVYQWDSGQYCPRPDKLVRLAEFLETSVDALLREDVKDGQP